MNSMEILNIDNLRNFIYDNSRKKVLIGSRRVGKTSAMLLNVFRNSIGPARDSLFLVPHTGLIKPMSSKLISICEEYNYPIETSSQNKSCYRIKIGESNVYIMTWKAFSESFRHLRIKDVYIDEPNVYSNINDIFEEIEYRTHWANGDSKIILAGSSYLNSTTLKNISADVSFSRHVARATDIPEYKQFVEEMRALLSQEQFRAEMMCEFI